MSPRPYLVVLTGGALPTEDGPPEPDRNDIELILTRVGTEDADEAQPGGLLHQIAAAGFRHGYHRAAQLHRVVAIYPVDDPAEAQMLAAAVGREVDPAAYVTHALSPLAEALSCYRQARAAADEQVVDVEIADDDRETV